MKTLFFKKTGQNIKDSWNNFKWEIPSLIKWALIVSVIFTLLLWQSFVQHKIHSWVQHDKRLYEIMEAMDFMDFVTNGGGSFGYANQYKWAYAKWINDPARTPVERFFFGNAGIIYEATNPPEEYQYPPLFDS